MIDDNVPIPEEAAKPPKKTRARKPKVDKVSPAAGLLAAIKFVSVAQKKIGTTEQQYCIVSNNWVAATNGVITAAAKIEEDLSACPHTFRMIDALSKCGSELGIVQHSEHALSIKSGPFIGQVPCVSFDELSVNGPDPMCATIDDKVKAALGIVMCMANEGAAQAYAASVLLQAGSAVATNGFALLEAWHGHDLPSNMLVPRSAAQAIAKCPKALVGFGYSGASATFYFEDGSFIKTQLYAEQYPNYQTQLEVQGLNPWALPEEFFIGVRAIHSFSENGVVYFNTAGVYSQTFEPEASTYKVAGLPEGLAYNAAYLIMFESHMQKVHFDLESKRVYFFGDNVRGVLAGCEVGKEAPPVDKEYGDDGFDDDTPF